MSVKETKRGTVLLQEEVRSVREGCEAAAGHG